MGSGGVINNFSSSLIRVGHVTVGLGQPVRVEGVVIFVGRSGTRVSAPFTSSMFFVHSLCYKCSIVGLSVALNSFRWYVKGATLRSAYFGGWDVPST